MRRWGGRSDERRTPGLSGAGQGRSTWNEARIPRLPAAPLFGGPFTIHYWSIKSIFNREKTILLRLTVNLLVRFIFESAISRVTNEPTGPRTMLMD